MIRNMMTFCKLFSSFIYFKAYVLNLKNERSSAQDGCVF